MFSKASVKIDPKKSCLNFSSAHIKSCRSLNPNAIVKSMVLHGRLLSFHRLLLETTMMKCVSVFNQKPTHVLL